MSNMEYNADAGVTTTPAYRIAMGMYVSIGGNPSKVFDSVDAIYAEIDRLFASSGGGTSIITPLDIELIENGTYHYSEDAISGYKPVSVTVDVPQKYTDEQVTQLQQDSYNEGYSEGETKGYNNGYTAGNTEGYSEGYSEGLDDGAEDQKALLESITITENGTYTREDGYNNVVVEIETGGGGGAGFDYTPIGYEQSLQNMLNQTTQNRIAYAKERLDYFNSKNTIEAQYFFKDDTQIVFAPILDLNTRIYQNASYTSLSGVFQGATNLEIFPGIIGKPDSIASGMFKNCKKLYYVGHFDTSTLNDMSFMFQDCTTLTTVPLFDTSKVTNMSYMFYDCESLTTVPLFDTSKVTNMFSMFKNCAALTTVPQFDASKVTNVSSVFADCTNLIDVGGLINLGMQSNLSTPTSKYSGIFYNCKNITRESVLNIFNGLYDRASAGYSNLKLIFEADVINRLTEDDIAIATNKGWTISQ